MPHLEPNKALKVVEDFRRVHEAFERINFNAFDFDSIKASLIEYLRLFFPEDFNDYIESSEIIALIETFAYVGELIAYRLDLNAHENFITQAEKKESILRLARLISFNASRRQSARGLVRIDSISTTEEVRDSLNNQLRNRVIKFNDPNNPNWQEQFFTIISLLLRQKFGEPQKTETINGTTFDRYSTKVSGLDKGVFPYTVNTSLKNVSMEIISTDIDSTGAIEAVPNPDGDFQILFVDDGLGLGSNGTGFQILTVQGEIVRNAFNFEQPIPNRGIELPQPGLNQKDIHVIQVLEADSDTIVEVWNRVDSLQGEHLHFDPSTERRNYEATTLEDDRVEVRFGDSAFATIPVGPFNIWARTSEADPVIVPRTKVQEEEFSFTYQDVEGNTQQGTFRFSLINSLANAVSSQDVESIRTIAPSIYYTQNRMVNSRDYNEFLFQDPAVLKLKAVNRTFSGQTKFLDFQDASGNFQNIKLFGDDLRMLLFEDIISQISTSTQGATDSQLITSIIEPLLVRDDVKTHLRRIQGVESPRTLFREEVDTSAAFDFDVVRIQGSNTTASGAAASTLIWRFPADGVASTFTASNAAFFVRDGISISAGDFTVNSASTVDINSSAGTGSVFMAASIGSIDFDSSVFTPYPQPGHKQEKTDIQGRVDGRYFGTNGSVIGDFAADGLIRTGNNKNIYILDINIPASAVSAGVTASSFVVGASVAGSAATGLVESIYPIPNASGVASSIFGVGAVVFLSASSTATADFEFGEFITLSVSSVSVTGSGTNPAIARIVSGSTAAPDINLFTYQFQVSGSASVGACSLGRHTETASAIVSTTGTTSNDAFGIAFDKDLDQYYTITPQDLGAELAPWSRANARDVSASNLDDSWIIRALEIKTSGVTNWKIVFRTLEEAAQGITTDFFYQNDRLLENSITGLIVEDTITALGVNFDTKLIAAIGSNLIFPVVRQPTDTVTSLIDKDRLIIKDQDTDQDGVPDDPEQFCTLVDGISSELILSLDGANNDLTAVPPEQQVARDGATVYGVDRHVFDFSDGEVKWQELKNRWFDGAFLQDFVDQSSFVSASNVSGSTFEYTFAASIIGSLVGSATLVGPQVVAGSAAAPSSTLVELTRGTDYEITGSGFNIISISAAIDLASTLGEAAASDIQLVVRQFGITTSVVDNLQMAQVTTGASPLNERGDVPFTVETYLCMNAIDGSTLVIYDQFEDFNGSSGGYSLRVEGSQIIFKIGGCAGSLEASVTAAGILDGTFHHLAGVFTRGLKFSNSSLFDLSIVKDGDRLTNLDNSSFATIYDLEVVNTSNAIAWVKNINDKGAGSSLFGFASADILRIDVLQADGSFSSLLASPLTATDDLKDYIRAYASGVAGTEVEASAFGLQNVSASAEVKMMRGLLGSATAIPRAFCDGITVVREARYGGPFTPGRIQPQTVFFDRVDTLSNYEPVVTNPTPTDLNTDQDSFDPAERLIREYIGRDDVNFLWSHFTPRRNLVDPSKTNIIDMFIHTLGYQNELEDWLERDNPFEEIPAPPTPTDLRIAFGRFLDKAMLSDTVVLHPGRIKFLFGNRADAELRAKFRVIKKEESLVADDHLRTLVLDVIREYFDIIDWDFGRVFFFTDLAAKIHQSLPKDVQSVVLVPTEGENRFGDLFQIVPGEDQILQSAAKGSDIEIIEDITRQNIRRVEI